MTNSNSAWTDARVVFALALGGLFVANAGVLTAPPYWDAAVGYLPQAIWLAQHDLDLVGLASEPSYSQGGPRVWLPYLMSVVAALLYRTLPPVGVFVVLHLLSIASAALVFTVFLALLRRHLPPREAFAWCLAGLIEPVFSGQTAAIYLDLPAAAAAALVLRAALRERWWSVVLWTGLGFLIKPTLALVAAAVLTWLALRLTCKRWLGGEVGAPARAAWPALLLAPLLGFLLIEALRSAPGSAAPAVLDWAVLRLAPSQALMLLLACGLLLALVRRAWLQRARLDDEAIHAGLLMAVLVAGFWVAFAVRPNSLIRYSTLVVFPTVAVLALLARAALGVRGVALALLFLVAAAVNQYGLLLPALPPAVARSGQFLERSREYLVEQESTRRFVAELELHYSDHAIVTNMPYTQMLTLPELGYVARPLRRVFAGDHALSYAPVAPASREVLAAPDTLFIFAPVTFAYWQSPAQLAARGAMELVYAETSMEPPLLLYRHPRTAGSPGGAP